MTRTIIGRICRCVPNGDNWRVNLNNKKLNLTRIIKPLTIYYPLEIRLQIVIFSSLCKFHSVSSKPLAEHLTHFACVCLWMACCLATISSRSYLHDGDAYANSGIPLQLTRRSISVRNSMCFPLWSMIIKVHRPLHSPPWGTSWYFHNHKGYHTHIAISKIHSRRSSPPPSPHPPASPFIITIIHQHLQPQSPPTRIFCSTAISPRVDRVIWTVGDVGGIGKQG